MSAKAGTGNFRAVVRARRLMAEGKCPHCERPIGEAIDAEQLLERLVGSILRREKELCGGSQTAGHTIVARAKECYHLSAGYRKVGNPNG